MESIHIFAKELLVDVVNIFTANISEKIGTKCKVLKLQEYGVLE